MAAMVLNGTAAVVRESVPGRPVGVFPPKDTRIVITSVQLPQTLVETIDWIAQKEGYSRSFALETAALMLINKWEADAKVKAGQLPIKSKKRRHRTTQSLRRRQASPQ